MEQTLLLQILVCASLVHQSVAFLPSHAGVTLASTDYTLTDLTVAGIVRAVARYFEDSNPTRYKSGDLTELDPLTPSRLIQEHYGQGNLSVFDIIRFRMKGAIISNNYKWTMHSFVEVLTCKRGSQLSYLHTHIYIYISGSD